MNVQNVRARGEPGKADDISAISGSNRLTFLAAEIKNEHKAVSAALQRGVIHAMNAGDLLIEAKAHLKHGQWLPWVAKNCAFSERTIQLYIKLAKNRATIEKEMANPQSVADLTLNEAAALCVLAGRIEKLIEYAKRAETSTPDDLIEFCMKEGIGVIKDDAYDPFMGAPKENNSTGYCSAGSSVTDQSLPSITSSGFFSARFRTLRNGLGRKATNSAPIHFPQCRLSPTNAARRRKNGTPNAAT